METAKELREKLQQRFDEGDTLELKEIEKLLIEAVKNEQHEVYLPNRRLRPNTMRVLEFKGLNVEVSGRYNEINTVITIPKQ